ncbi:cell cycle control protein tyrosine phosphatase [Grosmannia clavigera kw1407]|uniref:M-phase inducer phosphatase n=1 Tax=Grosmannia clavigera (strain kw1407 / UAMH 11150) TaxID=655863 RepID=F0XS15_GROCL|nr:cell cycle control protein tyrosine phosphatase [Grosmannia clavigera kw1407]EFW99651.1 cell cycle control protein tyrosine phosphatase [Grosmannia clavigera kw1407]
METSSPLAAMHRPAAPFGKRDLFANLHVRLSPQRPRAGAGSFSIHDQMNQESDYFGMKPIHGSSPAGSLAADLCQNFTIGEDASPRFPTPRRALFTSNHVVPVERRGFMKRPPPMPVSSSPSMMDMTPAPRRTQRTSKIDMSSPLAAASLGASPLQASPLRASCMDASPASTSDDEMMLESPCPGPQPAAVDLPRAFASGIERRKPLRRSSLTRTKGYSFAGPTRFSSDTQLPVFRFGESRLPAAAPTSSLTASECFQDSSPAPAAAQSRPHSSYSPTPSPSVGPIRSRPSLLSMGNAAAAARSGSPSHGMGVGHGHGHIRRTSSSLARPRRQYRRSISMFESPVDVVQSKREDGVMLQPAPVLQPSLLASAMDTDDCASSEPMLPHFLPADPTDCIPRIDRSTLLRVMDGEFDNSFQNKLIIDCRFEYEYDGGHISEAVNFNDKDLLASHLFHNNQAEGRTLIVLHCEYSAHRAPLMARHIRAEDRAANIESYPRLSYPELYILDGGYSGFFGEHPSRCHPQAYVEMDAVEHALACEREMGRLRQNRKGLHRAQTFAFGQQQQQQQPAASQRSYQFNEFSSPTAPGRPIPQESPCMMLGASPILGCDRGHNRRMASY